MAGLDPAIHVFSASKESKTWMRGSSPRMTELDLPANHQRLERADALEFLLAFEHLR
jgi:hypothetical protein